jgi:hypothetical protein
MTLRRSKTFDGSSVKDQNNLASQPSSPILNKKNSIQKLNNNNTSQKDLAQEAVDLSTWQFSDNW